MNDVHVVRGAVTMFDVGGVSLHNSDLWDPLE